MTFLAALWLPMLLAIVAVFVASSIIHMGPFWHKHDYPRLTNEDAVRGAMGPLRLAPGDYMIPRPATREEMKTAEFQQKMKDGPVLALTVFPNGEFGWGRNLGLWAIYIALVIFFSAGIAWHALTAGADLHRVFHYVGAISFIGFSVALWQMSIWYRRAWSYTVKATIDGAIYAAIAAGIFAWLWPR